MGSDWLLDLGHEIMLTNNVTKFDDDPLKNIQVTEWTLFILCNFCYFKGHNSKVLYGIWLVIRLGQEIMLTNYVTKFDDDPLKNIRSYRADKVNFVQFCLIQEP